MTYVAKSCTIRLSAFDSLFCGTEFWLSRNRSPLLAITAGLLLIGCCSKCVRSFVSEFCANGKINETFRNNKIFDFDLLISKLNYFNSITICVHMIDTYTQTPTWWTASSLHRIQFARKLINWRTRSIVFGGTQIFVFDYNAIVAD